MPPCSLMHAESRMRAYGTHFHPTARPACRLLPIVPGLGLLRLAPKQRCSKPASAAHSSSETGAGSQSLSPQSSAGVPGAHSAAVSVDTLQEPGSSSSRAVGVVPAPDSINSLQAPSSSTGPDSPAVSANGQGNSSATLTQAAAALQQQGVDALAPLQQQQQQQQHTDEAPSVAAAVAGPKQPSNFVKRVIAGIVLGLGGAAVVAVGGIPYLFVALLVVYQASQEYYGFVTSKGITQGRDPPTRFVSITTTALCLGIVMFTFLTKGKIGTAMSVAAFVLLVMNILLTKKPTFSQLTSAVFGLFYCGYLPSFWLKLRNLNVPAPDIQWPALAASLPIPLPELTVGLYATLTSVACIIAADTGAYFVGKNLGRTKLTEISPKKTVEGAVGGLASAVGVALLFWQLCRWPESWAAAAGYGVVTFFSSLFGDLIESIMKRDAGLKDSGDLIPGHGGLLDRFDSYMFSGAVAYFYITFLLPRFGLA